MVSDEIWYREELLALRALVAQEIQTGRWGGDQLAAVALGGLVLKLDRQLQTAPSARTPEAAA